MKTGLERQLSLIAKRKAEGMARLTVWVSQRAVESLKKRFPGARGGIDWDSVIRAALEPQAQPGDDEAEQLRRKVRALERSATETAKKHRDQIADWRKLVDALDAKCARLEEDLRNQNSDRLG